MAISFDLWTYSCNRNDSKKGQAPLRAPLRIWLSTAAIGGEPKRRNQQRNVVMRLVG